MNREIVNSLSPEIQMVLKSFFEAGEDFLEIFRNQIIVPGKNGVPTISQEFYFSDQGRVFFCMSSIFKQIRDYSTRGILPQIGYLKDNFDHENIKKTLMYILKHLKKYLEENNIQKEEIHGLFLQIISLYQIDDILKEVFEGTIPNIIEDIGNNVKSITKQ